MQVSPPFSFAFSFIRFTSVYDPVNFLFGRTLFCVDFFVFSLFYVTTDSYTEDEPVQLIDLVASFVSFSCLVNSFLSIITITNGLPNKKFNFRMNG